VTAASSIDLVWTKAVSGMVENSSLVLSISVGSSGYHDAVELERWRIGGCLSMARQSASESLAAGEKAKSENGGARKKRKKKNALV